MMSKRKPIRAISLFLAVLLLLSAQVFPAASAAEPNEFALYEGEKEFYLYIEVVNELTAYAGIEFGLTLSSETALTFESFDQKANTPVSGAARSPFVTVNGTHYFGFYRGTNAFDDDITVGPLRFSYTGTAPQTITLSHVQVARISNGRTVGAKKASPVGIYTVRRMPGARPDDTEMENGIPVFTVTIDDEAVPLSGGRMRSAYFDDVTEDWSWAVEAIDFLYEVGVVKGTGGRMYTPGANIQRGDFMLMLARAYDLHGSFEENFTDVPPDSYFYEAIGIARQLGIAQGPGDGTFAPNTPITRQDMMTLVERTLRVVGKPLPEGVEADLAAFLDWDTIYNYAVTPVATLVKSEIVRGTDLGLLNPLGNTTRAEMAVVVYRLLMLEQDSGA